MRLTVLSVAYPVTQVSPDTVGGAEQVVSFLDHALVSQGHRSIVIAGQGSKIAGVFLELPSVRGELTLEKRALMQRHCQVAIQEALDRFDVELVHMHGVDFNSYLPQCQLPVLVTLHLPLTWYPSDIFQLDRKNVYLHCVSKSQRRSCPDNTVQMLPEIQNGIPLQAFTPGSDKEDFVACLGRICPEKGFHIAIEAAIHADMTLLIAGQVFRYPEHERYFLEQIAPRLDPRRRFLGPLGFHKKRDLLARARCILIPSLVAETSSLVAMEALASGTPVIAFPSGALPEIVEHGKTGFLVKNQDEMAEAIHLCKNIHPSICRQAACERFSADTMFHRYLETYQQLIKAHE